MATIVNDKDKILQAAAVRLPAILGNYIYFSTPAPVFKVAAGGTTTPSSYAITAKFSGQLAGTVTWSLVSGTITPTTGQSGNTWTITPAQLTTDSAVVRATLVYLGTTYTSDFTISKVSDGASPVNVILSNDSFTFTASSTGTVSSYANSGTTIKVSEGTTDLTYDAVGTSNSTWKVTAVASGITAGTIVDSGSFATVGAASGMADATDTATITYTITGKTSAGVSFSITKIQNFSKSKTGATGTGTAGTNGISSLTAYKVQAQTAATPTFTTPTTGAVAPTGWSLTSLTPAVGQVLWYIDGRYNSSAVTVDGIAAGKTAWTGPIAVSVFQDIKSDNWNGTTPPVYGTPASYGTLGYYISKLTGNIFVNSGIFRGDINTTGDGKFAGSNNTTANLSGEYSAYKVDYSIYGEAITNVDNNTFIRAGLYGKSSESVAQVNVGVIGESPAALGKGYGVMGLGTYTGGYFGATSALSGAGLIASAYGPTYTAIKIEQGTFEWGLYNIATPTGSTSKYLRNDGAWSAVGTFAANSGSATANSTTGTSLLGSTSTGIAGAYVGTSGSGSTVTFTVQATSPSDSRLKQEVTDSDLGLNFVKQLRPVSYKLKADPKQQKGYGFIAQEVEEIIGADTSLVYFEPDWQVGDEVGFNTIHYPSYIAVLTKAIQELSSKVDSLQAQIDTLRNSQP